MCCAHRAHQEVPHLGGHLFRLQHKIPLLGCVAAQEYTHKITVDVAAPVYSQNSYMILHVPSINKHQNMAVATSTVSSAEDLVSYLACRNVEK